MHSRKKDGGVPSRPIARTAGTVVACALAWSCAAPARGPRAASERSSAREAVADVERIEPAGATPGSAVRAPPGPITGHLASKYRARWTADDRDHDLYEVLSLDYANPARKELSAHVMGRAAADLDGRDSGAGFVFDSLSDTYDSSVEAKLYHAYVDYEPAAGLAARVRAGRQIDYETPENAFFDGVSLRSRPRGPKALELGLYGGIPVHLYESSSDGDALLGTFAEARPWKGARARVDWMHLEDEVTLGAYDDDLVGLGLWQTLSREWSVDGQYTRLEGEDRDVRLRTRYANRNGELAARATYYELFEAQSSRALELDPFTSALQQYFPFRQGGVSVSRQVGKRATVDVGADVRRVRDDADVGEFNRDWERYHATVSVRDVLAAGLEVGVTADRWDGDGRDASTLGADVARDFGSAWRLSAGTYYSLYKYDLYLNRERDDVRTYFASARWKRSERLAFELSYDYEDDDFEQYHQVRWGATWRF